MEIDIKSLIYISPLDSYKLDSLNWSTADDQQVEMDI